MECKVYVPVAQLDLEHPPSKRTVTGSSPVGDTTFFLVKDRKITLNETEQKICEYIGKKRYEAARKNNITNRKIGTQSDHFTDVNGFGGELAFCKLFNVMADFFIKKPDSGLPEYDAVLPGGVKVDVKTTPYETGRLLVAKWKTGDVDCYALMTGTMPVYTFRGFISKKLALQDSNIRSLGHGEGYVIEQSTLLELEELYDVQPASCIPKTL